MKKKYLILILVIVLLAVALGMCFVPLFEIKRIYVPIEKDFAATDMDFQGYMPENSARCAIVIDAESKNVICSKNADERRGMASTTKIMTALVALEGFDTDLEYTIPREAVGVEGSSVYLKENEKLTLRELLYCLMLESGNDAATAIAICCGGSVESFAQMMNSRAAEMGLVNSHFDNPHGLNSSEHYTTARELAIITAEAMQYPLFREIVGCKTANVRYDGRDNGRRLVNHNKLLFSYEGANGIKTGYTRADGKCLVSSATRNGLTLIAVSLSDNAPTSTHRMLLDMCYEQYEQRTIAEEGALKAEIPLENCTDDYITVCNTQKISLCLPKGADLRIALTVPKKIDSQVDENTILAYATCYFGNEIVYVINLEATECAATKKRCLWELLGE